MIEWKLAGDFNENKAVINNDMFSEKRYIVKIKDSSLDLKI